MSRTIRDPDIIEILTLYGPSDARYWARDIEALRNGRPTCNGSNVMGTWNRAVVHDGVVIAIPQSGDRIDGEYPRVHEVALWAWILGLRERPMLELFTDEELFRWLSKARDVEEILTRTDAHRAEYQATIAALEEEKARRQGLV